MINYGYFRHRFDAYTDSKLMKLKEIGGVASVGCYFILLEIYGKSFSDDSTKNIEQIISARHVSNAFGLRSDSTRTQIELMSDCKLIDAVWLKSESSSIKVCIPNFLKYFGSYKKTGIEKGSNKRKENKRKEKVCVDEEKIIKNQKNEKQTTHNIIEEFSCLVDEAKKYAEKIPEEQQRKLIYEYGEEISNMYVLKLAEWDLRQIPSRRKKDYYLTIVKWIKDAGIESKSEFDRKQAKAIKMGEELLKSVNNGDLQ